MDEAERLIGISWVRTWQRRWVMLKRHAPLTHALWLALNTLSPKTHLLGRWLCVQQGFTASHIGKLQTRTAVNCTCKCCGTAASPC